MSYKYSFIIPLFISQLIVGVLFCLCRALKVTINLKLKAVLHLKESYATYFLRTIGFIPEILSGVFS